MHLYSKFALPSWHQCKICEWNGCCVRMFHYTANKACTYMGNQMKNSLQLNLTELNYTKYPINRYVTGPKTALDLKGSRIEESIASDFIPAFPEKQVIMEVGKVTDFETVRLTFPPWGCCPRRSPWPYVACVLSWLIWCLSTSALRLLRLGQHYKAEYDYGRFSLW